MWFTLIRCVKVLTPHMLFVVSTLWIVLFLWEMWRACKWCWSLWVLQKKKATHTLAAAGLSVNMVRRWERKQGCAFVVEGCSTLFTCSPNTSWVSWIIYFLWLMATFIVIWGTQLSLAAWFIAVICRKWTGSKLKHFRALQSDRSICWSHGLLTKTFRSIKTHFENWLYDWLRIWLSLGTEM